LSKPINKSMLKLIQEHIDVNKSTVDEVEAEYYWGDVNMFVEKNKREPSKDAQDKHEVKLAEVLAFVRLFKKRYKNEK